MIECKNIIKNINIFFKKIPLIFYFFPYILHIICTKYLINKNIDNNNLKQLDDILYNIIPNLYNYEYIVNIFLLLLLLPLIINPKKKYFVSIFKYFSIIIFLRCITVCVTIIPPTKNCKQIEYNNIYSFLNGHCIDKIFSGHTSFMIILFFIIYKNKILNNNLLLGYLFLILINSFLIVATRSHYTVDVILAYIIVPSVLLIIHDL